MKDLKQIEEILTLYKSVLQDKYKVLYIGVFGSYVHGEQSKVSDIDILVEFSEPVGWEFIDLKDFLETILEVKVDLVTKNALKPQIRDRILNEVVFA
jgi:predicted nucleotidyltransferase